MKRVLMLILLMNGIASPAWADSLSVKLSLPSMNCAVCPITVRKALEKVDGVTQADVDYKTRSAIVVYDDRKTNVERLTRATQDAGYPSIEVNLE